MGTGKLAGPAGAPSSYLSSSSYAGQAGSYLVPPDLLTEAAHCQLTPDSSCISADTLSTPASSEHADMSVIMRDYGNIDRGQPIIGSTAGTEGRGDGRRYLGWGEGTQSISKYLGSVGRRDKQESRRDNQESRREGGKESRRAEVQRGRRAEGTDRWVGGRVDRSPDTSGRSTASLLPNFKLSNQVKNLGEG